MKIADRISRIQPSITLEMTAKAAELKQQGIDVINLSVGEPDFKTVFGSSLSSQSNLSGYPAGTVNRHLFFNLSQSGGTAMIRNDWQLATIITLGELSPVNVGAIAQYDTISNILIVDVEIYYTDTQSVSLNYLNIADYFNKFK